MFKHIKIKSLDDFFAERDKRPEGGVYFYRINGYTGEVGRFIRKYCGEARHSGAVIEGRIQNPDEKNLDYYEEVMGMDFELDAAFISRSLKKWLPRMGESQRANVAEAIFETLATLRKAGKNDVMLKNAYIKFMCWLYYKFERVAGMLGENKVPKILYEGGVGSHELLFLAVLSGAGCDIVLLQYGGDEKYLKLDAQSLLSDNLELPGMGAFPSDFDLKHMFDEMREAADNERIYGTMPKVLNCTNAWIEGDGFSDFKKSIALRGDDPKFFYNCFCRINGAPDRLTYAGELYRLQLELKNSGRRVVIVDGAIPKPGTDEIASVRRGNYRRTDEMLADLASNIQYGANIELQRLMVKAFLDVLLAEAKTEGMNLNRLTNRAVYMVCWIRRYAGLLFSNWKMPDIACFIHMGPCVYDSEALFLRILARIPVDVLVLNPDLNTKCCLEDNILYEINFSESLQMERYPQQGADAHIGTVAYNAERELDGVLYRDTGMYRNQQYAKASSVTLQTMYEEIGILWKEEPKFRPNFSTEGGVVTIPVIFAKVSGVKDGNARKYWSDARELVTEDTFVIKAAPYVDSAAPNPMKAYAVEFFKNGRVQKKKIKEHKSYPYAFLRDEVQEHILDKLQLLIEGRAIKGTFENGTEYTTVATVLNMPKEIVRLIQKFDFTKRNPKLLYFNTGEKMISLEDSILAAFLNLTGFDVVFFVPTGYRNIEGHFNRKLLEEHQIGEYMYDLRVPDMEAAGKNTFWSWCDKILGTR